VDRSILHVDMDAFFAAIEVLDDPLLRGRAVIVGAEGPRGVVASCTYEARAFGVRSAMASVEAKRRCPHAVFVPGRHDRYGEVSATLHEVFHEFSPLVEPIALDEAFIDISGSWRRQTPQATALAVRAAVQERTSLRCSVGLATVKFIAKLASEAAKPRVRRSNARERFGGAAEPGVVVTPRRPGDGLGPVGAVVVAEGVVDIAGPDTLAFLHAHPARSLWGVGPVTMERLARFGVETVGDIARLPQETLVSALGPASGQHLWELSQGRDPRAVVPERETKSVGHEETFVEDITDPARLHIEVVRLADAVARRLARSAGAARTVTVKLKWPDFTLTTRSRTIPQPTASGPQIADVADELLREPELAARIAGTGVRLLGLSVSGFGEPDSGVAQLSLFEPDQDVPNLATSPTAPDAEALDAVVAAVRRRFGDDSLVPTTLTGQPGSRQAQLSRAVRRASREPNPNSTDSTDSTGS
jgi:DNA polymerase IV